MENTSRYNTDRDDSRAWTREANCAGRYDLFDYDSKRPDGIKIKEAKTICGQCAVREVCLEDALTNNESYDVRGGFTPSERKNLTNPRRR